MQAWLEIFDFKTPTTRKNYWFWKIGNKIIIGILILIVISTTFVMHLFSRTLLYNIVRYYLIYHFIMVVPHIIIDYERYRDVGLALWWVIVLAIMRIIPLCSNIAGMINVIICLMPHNEIDNLKETVVKQKKSDYN